MLPASLPLLMEAPRGDGHPVLLLPGFMAGESTLIALKLFLQKKGYDVHTWGLGRNVGFRGKHANALPQKIRYLHHITGRKVSLVGWSLGGVFSFYGAESAMECVRSIITLGSPVSVDHGDSQSPPAMKAIYRLVSHRLGTSAHIMKPRAKAMRERQRLPIPTSCLYSLSDGVVPPQEATIDGDPALHENIQVAGSHIGLGFNGIVLAIVADRLAQPEDDWQPFQPKGMLARVLQLTSGPATRRRSPVSRIEICYESYSMRQLSEHDASFIYSDSAHANSNVTLLHIYDQSTAPGGVVRFKQIQAHVKSRLERLPHLREKILRVPLDLDYPYWVEDETSISTTTSTILRCPSRVTGASSVFSASRIHARPLDLQRPLWEMYVIEGLDSFLDLPVGSFAVLIKIHHAAINVASGDEITSLLHDLSPVSRAPSPARAMVSGRRTRQLASVLSDGLESRHLPAARGSTGWDPVDLLSGGRENPRRRVLDPTERVSDDTLQYRGVIRSRV